MPQEQPPPQTPCVVTSCDRPATVYVDVTEGAVAGGDQAVPMCDEHAAHWRDGG